TANQRREEGGRKILVKLRDEAGLGFSGAQNRCIKRWYPIGTRELSWTCCQRRRCTTDKDHSVRVDRNGCCHIITAAAEFLKRKSFNSIPSPGTGSELCRIDADHECIFATVVCRRCQRDRSGRVECGQSSRSAISRYVKRVGSLYRNAV